MRTSSSEQPSFALEIKDEKQPPPFVQLNERISLFVAIKGGGLDVDLTDKFVSVGLLNEDGTEHVVPPRQDVLTGLTVLTPKVEPDGDTVEPDGDTVGYAAFSGLTITKSDTYRFHVSLIEIGPTFHNLCTVDSKNFHVTRIYPLPNLNQSAGKLRTPIVQRRLLHPPKLPTEWEIRDEEFPLSPKLAKLVTENPEATKIVARCRSNCDFASSDIFKFL